MDGSLNAILCVIHSVVDSADSFPPRAHDSQVAAKADLLPLLERMVKVDETVVREAACISAQAVGASMDAGEISASFVPLVKGLLAESWWTGKVSGVCLISTAYPLAEEGIRAELKASFMQITKDEAPMVRRAVAKNLGCICAVLEPDSVPRDLLPSFNKLSNDDQDSVRVLAFGSALEMCTTQPADQCTQFIFPAVGNFAKDASWRVRLEVARSLGTLVANAYPDAGEMPLNVAAALIKDPELDVRRFTLDKIVSVVKQYKDKVESSGILAALCELANVDPEVPNSLQMKVLLAKHSIVVAEELGEAVARTHIVPLIVSLVQEEAVEIRIAALEGFAPLVKVAGGATVLGALPLESISSDSSWRVRQAFLEGIPTLAASVPRADFDAELLPLLKLLVGGDMIASVRQSGGKVLSEFGTNPAFGEEFCKAVVEPLVEEMAENESCFYRISAMQCARDLALAGIGCVADACASAALSLVLDKVANVRINVCWCAGALGEKKLGADKLRGSLKEAMVSLSNTDSDPDVVHFATEAASKF